jgi:hypothetical protein
LQCDWPFEFGSAFPTGWCSERHWVTASDSERASTTETGFGRASETGFGSACAFGTESAKLFASGSGTAKQFE